MLKKLKSNNKGFTIIEVLIVLAIAALIMLIVFLAVPALQRNSRNTQRNSDGARVLSSVNECLNNHNYVTTACDTAAELGFNAAEMALLKTSPVFDNGTGSTTGAHVGLNSSCDATGTTSTAGAARSTTVQYQLETGSATTSKCISS